MPKKVFVLKGDSSSYYEPYRSFGPEERDFGQLVSNPSDIGLVVFCGGTDITPALYGETPWTGKKDFAYRYDLERDMKEVLAFKIARTMGIPISGICRGAQFLYAMFGGKLRQDIRGHTGTQHYTTTRTHGSILTTSDHHQNPDIRYKPDNIDITAWAPIGPSETSVEAFEGDKVVAFQFHPEWSSKDSPEWAYAQDRISTLF